MKVSNMTSDNGNKIANQFIIYTPEATYFQSYESIIVKTSFDGDQRTVELDETYWNYSRTTNKYRNMFLGDTTKEVQAKIDSGEYTLTDLNN
jgi:hypothetical protein